MVDPEWPFAEGAESTGPRITELRIHGVGGAGPAEILDRGDIVVEDADRTAGFYTTATDGGSRRLVAYSWGGLTSRKSTASLWTLLLPFAFINVAGWMLEPPEESDHGASVPDEQPRRRWVARLEESIEASVARVAHRCRWMTSRALLGMQRRLVHLVAIAATATYTMWVALLTMNVVGYQCGAQQTCYGDRPWLHYVGEFQDHPGQRVVIGALAPIGLLFLFLFLSRRSRQRYAYQSGGGESDDGGAGAPTEKGLASPSFWRQSGFIRSMGLLHFAISLGLLSATTAYATSEFGMLLQRPLVVPSLALAWIGVVLLAAWLVLVEAQLRKRRAGPGDSKVQRGPQYAFWVSVGHACLTMGLAWRMEAPDGQLAPGTAADDLWGFGWAPFVLMVVALTALAAATVLQLIRWALDHHIDLAQFFIPVAFLFVALVPTLWSLLLVALVVVWFNIRTQWELAKTGERGDRRHARRRARSSSRLPASVGAVALIAAVLALSGVRLGWSWLIPVGGLIFLVARRDRSTIRVQLSQGRKALAEVTRWTARTLSRGWLVVLVAAVLVAASLALGTGWLLAGVILALVASAYQYTAASRRRAVFRWFGTAAVACVGFLGLTGILAGVSLWIVDVLGDISVSRGAVLGVVRAGVGEASAAATEEIGRVVETAGTAQLKMPAVTGWMALSAFLATVAAWTGGALFLGQAWLGRWAAVPRHQTAPSGEEVHQPRGIVSSRVRWQAWVDFARSADVLVTTYAMSMFSAAAVGVIFVIRRFGLDDVSRWIDQRVPDELATWVTVAAWAEVLYVVVAYFVVRSALRDTGVRRRLSIIWDVASFWPNRFHPFSPPAYAARAVPELADKIRRSLDEGDDRRVIVSGHSQGSVLALAATALLDDAHASRVALVTHGSPLGPFYERFFPAYFTSDLLCNVGRRLNGNDSWGDGSWINFYRDTDPIAGGLLISAAPVPGLRLRHVAAQLRRNAELRGANAEQPRDQIAPPDVALCDPCRCATPSAVRPPVVHVHLDYQREPCVVELTEALCRDLVDAEP